MYHSIEFKPVTILFENEPVKFTAMRGFVPILEEYVTFGVYSDDDIFYDVFGLKTFAFKIKPHIDFDLSMVPDLTDARRIDLIRAVYQGINDAFYKKRSE